jgi:hypothetical protein
LWQRAQPSHPHTQTHTTPSNQQSSHFCRGRGGDKRGRREDWRIAQLSRCRRLFCISNMREQLSLFSQPNWFHPATPKEESNSQEKQCLKNISMVYSLKNPPTPASKHIFFSWSYF